MTIRRFIDLDIFFIYYFQIPEYCKAMDESEIVDQAFPLIFAFDEIVALGYRESVNLAQIRTFTQMDSHEEKVAQAVREVRLIPLSKLYYGLMHICFVSLIKKHFES